MKSAPQSTSPFSGSGAISRRQVARFAMGLAGVSGLGAVGISSVRARHGDDDLNDDDWVVGTGGSGGSGGLDDDWVFGSGGSGGSGSTGGWVFGSGGSGSSGDDDWIDD